MSDPHVLIVEDEKKLSDLLVDYFTQSGYRCDCLYRGDEVEAWLAANSTDAIILDVNLPGKDGMSVCRDIRQTSEVPILMVTARVEEVDRLLGLELGADDYICKPFSPREVVARVKVVLRRTINATPASNDKIQLNQEQLTISVDGQVLELTSIEFGIIKLLCDEPGRIFSRDQLMDNIYQDHRIVSDRTIDSHIKKLRKKLDTLTEEQLIHSVYGVGYKLVL